MLAGGYTSLLCHASSELKWTPTGGDCLCGDFWIATSQIDIVTLCRRAIFWCPSGVFNFSRTVSFVGFLDHGSESCEYVS